VGAGFVSERVGVFTLIRAGYVLQIVALGALFWVSSREALMAALVLFGIGFAAADTMITKVIPDVFGLRAIGAIMGVLTLGWRCGAALGPAVAGFVYDATGTYAIPFGAAPAVVVVSWILFSLATRRGR
jgi:predicted MFS family arabinose efflux permease